MELTPKDREELQRLVGRVEGVLSAAEGLGHNARIILDEAVGEIIKVLDPGCETKQELLKKYKEAMAEAANMHDEEVAHGRADDVLCELLRVLGFGEVVEIFENIDKWYA
jgi:hypothetical protein